ncbi:MAG: DUF4139 domain-containing protein [Polyangiaceae bacterium]
MRIHVGALLLGLLGLTGCANTANVSSNLPLERVVIYRNGIAYFERGGRVEDAEVRFKMKEGAVGDFLATLAVMEKGGSSVKAAAFPIPSPEDVPTCDPNPAALMPRKQRIGDFYPEPRLRPCTEYERRHIREVMLQLDGKSHDLQVGYITEAPVWRPSYRLVVEGNGTASMQAWGIVQNLSGEDWKNVRLSLVAGAPLAFEATLGTPVTPTRPTVTDEGEVIAAVPRSETSLQQEQYQKQANQAAPAPSVAPAAPPAEAADLDDEDDAGLAEKAERRSAGPMKKDATRSLGTRGSGVGGGGKGMGLGSGRAASAPKTAAKPTDGMAPPPPPPPPPRVSTTPSGPRNLQSLAAVSATGGVTRYDLPELVTVPDKAATMVMLLAKKIPGDAAFLYAPDGAVPESYSHPYRVVRFVNKSGGTLEKGPIAVFDRGAFLGQGMVDPLPNGATATVPFALDRGLAIDKSSKRDELGERVQKIDNGLLTIERDSSTQTIYRIRNGGDTNAKVLVKHPRISGSRLERAPAGTEDNVGTGSALVPYDIGTKKEGELVVDERISVQRNESWTSPVADAAVKALLADPTVDAATKNALTEAWKIRSEILHLNDVQSEHQRELSEVSNQSEETRRSLRSIEKNRVADKLRAQLTKRLEDLSKRSEEVGKKLVEAQAKLAELNVRFRDLLRSIKYYAPVTLKK